MKTHQARKFLIIFSTNFVDIEICCFLLFIPFYKTIKIEIKMQIKQLHGVSSTYGGWTKCKLNWIYEAFFWDFVLVMKTFWRLVLFYKNRNLKSRKCFKKFFGWQGIEPGSIDWNAAMYANHNTTNAN